MRSNYRIIGDFIKQSRLKNEDGRIDRLLGVNLDKKFMPSVANLNGVDLTKYKVIKKGQFGCKLMSVGRDKKVPISRLTSFEEAIISSAYFVFEVKDENELNPEYLMMWFSRSESDRFQWFQSGADIRGRITWEEFCSLPIKVPSIEKQRAIVKEYNTIVNRIKLNEQLTQKLEETAQALYKHWFVDFEFPDENGQPYKSSGGKLVYNEELDQEIPEGWEATVLGNIIESHSKKHEFDKEELIFFNTSDILNGDFLHSNYSRVEKMPGQAKKSIRKNDILYSEIRPANKRFALVRIDAHDYVVSTKLMVLRLINQKVSHLRVYQFLTYPKFIQKLQQSAEGRSGTFPQITFEEHLENHPFLLAKEDLEKKFKEFLTGNYIQFFARRDENKILKEMKEIVLSRMSKNINVKSEISI